MELPKEYYIDFDTLKVGDKVWHIAKGEKVVTDIDNGEIYLIEVDNTDTYTKEGFNVIGDKFPTLYAKNPFELLKNQERVILVNFCGEWIERNVEKWIDGKPLVENIDNTCYFLATSWKELESPKELTLEEIVKKQGEEIKKLKEMVLKR